jgi:hypothetical protein
MSSPEPQTKVPDLATFNNPIDRAKALEAAGMRYIDPSSIAGVSEKDILAGQEVRLDFPSIYLRC